MNNEKVKEFFDMKSLHWEERKPRSKETYDEFAKNFFHLKPGDKVLDLGCGSGTFMHAIYEITQGPIVGLDISSKMIDLAIPKFEGNKDITFIAEDFYSCDLKDFDVIVCHNAYSHFIYPKEFKDKVAKTLKPGGYLIISHFVNFEDINKRHLHCNPLVARQLESSAKEAELFLDEFDVVEATDYPYYNIILRKK